MLVGLTGLMCWVGSPSSKKSRLWVGCGAGWNIETGSWMSAHCWVLRRHLLWGVFSAPSPDRLTRPLVVGVVVVGAGWGVVVC